MVISFTDATLSNQPRGVASYYDMLGENAFGNFRKLIEDVTLSSDDGHLPVLASRNQKEDAATGRVPDLNFAREITQLFTIGQYELNPDGTLHDGRERPAGARLHLAPTSPACAGVHRLQLVRRPEPHRPHQPPLLRQRRQPRARLAADAGLRRVHAEHQLPLDQRRRPSSASTIPAQTTPTADGDLKIALDTLFNHPNVGPFIGKQLIQRLVTSNPSPAYVGRVAAAFNDNGSGVRGDMKAVWTRDPARPRGAHREHVDRATASCASRWCAWQLACARSTRPRPAAATPASA